MLIFARLVLTTATGEIWAGIFAFTFDHHPKSIKNLTAVPLWMFQVWVLVHLLLRKQSNCMSCAWQWGSHGDKDFAWALLPVRGESCDTWNAMNPIRFKIIKDDMIHERKPWIWKDLVNMFGCGSFDSDAAINGRLDRQTRQNDHMIRYLPNSPFSVAHLHRYRSEQD